MIVRLVKMTFYKDFSSKFEDIFSERKAKIKACSGCQSVELLKEYNHSKTEVVYFTRSIWNKESDLEAYRKSVLFKDTWRHTKPLFSSKAEAWTLEIV